MLTSHHLLFAGIMSIQLLVDVVVDKIISIVEYNEAYIGNLILSNILLPFGKYAIRKEVSNSFYF